MNNIKKNKNVLFLGITSFFNDVGSEMIFSVMPIFMAGLGISKLWIGIIEGVAGAASSFSKIVSGWISDRIDSRKPLILIGYTLSTIVKPFLALTNFWYQVLAVRVFDRLGKGLRTPPRDVAKEQYGRAFGLHRGLDTAGAVVGSLLASLLLFIFTMYFDMPALIQYRNIFWFSVIPGILSVLVLAFFVFDIKHKIIIKDDIRISLHGFKHQFRRFLVISGIFELAKFSYVLFVLRAAGLGVAIPLIPILYLVYNLIFSLAARPVGQLADHIGIRKVLIVGYALFCFLHLGLASATTEHQAWLFFVVFGLAAAIIEVAPQAMVAHLSEPDRRATAYGYYHATVGLFALPATAIAGYLWDIFGAMVAFTYGAAVALIALVLLLTLIHDPKRV